jgi:hypothetical protein
MDDGDGGCVKGTWQYIFLPYVLHTFGLDTLRMTLETFYLASGPAHRQPE